MNMSYLDPENFPAWLRLTGLPDKNKSFDYESSSRLILTKTGTGEVFEFDTFQEAARFLATATGLAYSTAYAYLQRELNTLYRNYGWEVTGDLWK